MSEYTCGFFYFGFAKASLTYLCSKLLHMQRRICKSIQDNKN